MALNKVNVAFKNFEHLKRNLRYEINASRNRFSVFSASKSSKKEVGTDEPIKYSTTKSSKKTIDEILGFHKIPAVLPVEKYLIFVTILSFFIYFVIMRKKNALDDVLEGNLDTADDKVRLTNALLYAKINRLKTDEIEAELRKIAGK